MSRKTNAPRALLLRFLILQVLATATLAIPLTNPVSLLNSTITAATRPEGVIFQNATSAGVPGNMFDYRIVGTPLVLRITDTGATFTVDAVNLIIDAAIQKVIVKINDGHGSEYIDDGIFFEQSVEIDLLVTGLENAKLSYFLLGDVLAGLWQLMNQPWSTFREHVFYILLVGQDWEDIGYGHITKAPPPSPEPTLSSIGSTGPALHKVE